MELSDCGLGAVLKQTPMAGRIAKIHNENCCLLNPLLDFLIISDIVSSCSSVIDGSMVAGCRIFVLFIELLV